MQIEKYVNQDNGARETKWRQKIFNFWASPYGGDGSYEITSVSLSVRMSGCQFVGLIEDNFDYLLWFFPSSVCNALFSEVAH